MKRIQNKSKIIKSIGRFISINYLFKDNNINKKEVYNAILIDSRERVIITAILMCMLQTFYIISDIITDFYTRQIHAWANISAEVLLFSSSILVILCQVCFIKRDNPTANRIIISLYYLCILLGMFLYMFGDFVRGNIGDYFSASYFYMIIFAVVPCVYLFDEIIVFAIALFGTLLLNIQMSILELGGFTQYILIWITFLFISYYFRNNAIKLKVSIIIQEELRDELELQTLIDPLTTALNRKGLQDYLNQNFTKWVNDNQKCAIMMFDVDYFKQYNDTFSHLSGDECLKRIALALMNYCDSNNPHLFRYGGEEFIMFLVGLSDEQVLERAKELKSVVDNLMIKGASSEHEYVTVSVGVSIIDINEIVEANSLIAMVDEEMYNAKHNQRNCISINHRIYR